MGLLSNTGMYWHAKYVIEIHTNIPHLDFISFSFSDSFKVRFTQDDIVENVKEKDIRHL